MKAGCVALQTGPTAERMARILDPFGHQVDEHRNNLPEIVTGIADVYTDLVLKRDRQVNIKRPTGNHSWGWHMGTHIARSTASSSKKCNRTRRLGKIWRTDQKGEPPDLCSVVLSRRKAPDAFLKATADGRLTAAVLQSKVDEPKSTEAASAEAEALQDLQSVIKSLQSVVVGSVRDDAKIEAERRLSLQKELEVCCCEAAGQIQALREELQSVLVKFEDSSPMGKLDAEWLGALQDLQSVLKSKQSVVESVRDDAKIEAERRLSLRKDLEVCCCVTTTNLQLCEAAAQTQALREELQSVRVYW
eukprot:s219_g41.t1